MVEKVIISPTKVRAYGNIMMVKDSTDFEEYNCSLTESTDTVNGVLQTVFVEAYASPSVTVSLSASSSTIFVGGTVTLSATVLDDNVAVEGVSVNFKQGTTSIGSGTTDASGVATYTYTGASSGSFTFSASYGSVSSTSVSVTVNEVAVSSVGLSASESSIGVGESVLLTASVSWNDGESYDGETVTFYDGNTSLGTGVTDVNGVATLTASSLAVGSHSITASIDGVTSTAVSVTVGKLSTSTALTSSGNNVLVGTSVTLTATVTHNSSAVSGLTVTFYDGSTSLGSGTTNSSGVATLSTSSLSVATHSLTAVVSETSTYAGSTSPAVSVVVYDHTYSLSFSQSSYVATGGSVTLECTLLEDNVAKSGATVTLSDGSSQYSSITNSTGVATFSLTGLSATATWTCSYNNVSDTCTVTVQTYLFYDDCSSASGLTNYGSSVQFERTPTSTITYNNGEYLISGSSCCFAGHEILPMHGVDNAKLRVKFKLNTTSQAAYNQFCLFCTDKTVSNNPPYEYGCRVRNDRLLQYFPIGSETTFYTHTVAYSTDWFYLEVVKNGTSWTITLYDSSLNQLATNTRSLSSMTNPNWYLALLTDKGTNYSVHINEIIAEPI